MHPRIASALGALCLVTGVASAPPAGAAASEAAVLVQQGQKFERDGKPEVALELYRAALLVDPNDAEAHRLAAAVLVKKERCAEAVPALRAFLQLAPPAARQGAGWDQAVLDLATCLRAEQAHVEVRPTADGRCSLDGGPAREVVRDRPLVFDVAPGEHRVECAQGERSAPPLVVSVSGRETRALVVDLASLAAPAPAPAPVDPAPAVDPAAPGLLRLRSDLAALCILDGTVSLAVSSNWAERETAPGPHHLECTCAGNAPFVKDFRLEPAGRAELLLPYAVSGVSDVPLLPPSEVPLLPPEGPSAPTIDAAATPLPGTPPASILLRLEGTGWTCAVDEGEGRAQQVNGTLLFDVAPGEHRVRCTRDGFVPVEQRVLLVRGERVELRPKAIAQKGGKTPVVESTAPAAPPETAPGPRPGVDKIEWGYQGGFGAHLGTFGIGVSGRLNKWALQLGSGLYPLALSGTWFDKPGRTGLYVTAGYLRVAPGLFAGGSTRTGHGFFASSGLDIHTSDTLAVRIGLGLGVNTTGFSSGPFTFDLSLVYAP